MAPSISFTGILNMAKGLTASGLAAALALASLAGASGQTVPGLVASSVAYGASVAGSQAAGQTGTTRPPTDAEIAARAKVLLEHQHLNDEALEQYERIEHHVDRTGGAAPRVIDDKTYRVVPTGTRHDETAAERGRQPVDPAEYRKQLVAWEDLLELMLKPDDPRTKSAYAKWQKTKSGSQGNGGRGGGRLRDEMGRAGDVQRAPLRCLRTAAESEFSSALARAGHSDARHR